MIFVLHAILHNSSERNSSNMMRRLDCSWSNWRKLWVMTVNIHVGTHTHTILGQGTSPLGTVKGLSEHSKALSSLNQCKAACQAVWVQIRAKLSHSGLIRLTQHHRAAGHQNNKCINSLAVLSDTRWHHALYLSYMENCETEMIVQILNTNIAKSCGEYFFSGEVKMHPP